MKNVSRHENKKSYKTNAYDEESDSLKWMTFQNRVLQAKAKLSQKNDGD